jgi:alpha-N-arabinofuranosidase
VLEPHQVERALRTSQALIDRARYLQRVERPVYVAYDEWNVWFRNRDNQLEERYTLSDALAVATYLNAFVRHCRTVKIANLAQLVNVIAPIYTSPEGLFLQTIYHPLRLAADHLQEIALDVHVDAETFEHVDEHGRWPHRIADLGPFSTLDVSATRDADRRRLVVSVVNRSQDAPVRATIAIDGARPANGIVARTVTADDVTAQNSFDQPEAVTVAESKVAASSSELEYEFPAHSYTQLDIEIGDTR